MEHLNVFNDENFLKIFEKIMNQRHQVKSKLIQDIFIDALEGTMLDDIFHYLQSRFSGYNILSERAALFDDKKLILDKFTTFAKKHHVYFVEYYSQLEKAFYMQFFYMENAEPSDSDKSITDILVINDVLTNNSSDLEVFMTITLKPTIVKGNIREFARYYNMRYMEESK